ncbi:MAG: ABC transporter ATP-binding protein [Bacteroidia bacterium]|nr:ABC transporter ATP-binding protein [Bacteroidia bacterium]
MRLLIVSLWPFLTKYRFRLVWGMVFIVISNWFSIYPAQVVRDAFNLVADLIKQQNLVEGYAAGATLAPRFAYTLLFFGAIVLGAALLRGVFLFFVRQQIIVMSRLIEFDQKNQLFDHYQQYSLRILRQRQTGDLMSRISEDVGAVRMFTGPGIMYTLNTLVLFAMVMTTMLYVNAELTLYVLTPMPLLALAIYAVHNVINKKSEAVQAKLSDITSVSQETYSGIRLLRAYARETSAEAQFLAESEALKTKSLSLAKVDALFYPTILLLIGLSTTITVWIGGEKVIAGTVSLGNIAEFLIYINLLTWPVASLGWITSMIQKGAASQKRINELLSLKSELSFPHESPPITEGRIEFQAVTLTYPDTGIEALRGIDFQIPPGQVLGIVGTTGSGKSTLANLLVRLMDTTEGQIRIDGRPIQDYSEAALRQQVGYVPQDVFLFSDTIANNIAFGDLEADRARIEAAARFAGVYDDIVAFPEGFETVIGERGVTLSGGQKQRISIARAFLRQPRVLILDDALSAVDTRTEAQILANLKAQLGASGLPPTLILISHRLSGLEHAQHILVLDEGQIVEQGTHGQLLALGGTYAELYQHQLLEAEISAA